jgi:hypothetical protein
VQCTPELDYLPAHAARLPPQGSALTVHVQKV